MDIVNTIMSPMSWPKLWRRGWIVLLPVTGPLWFMLIMVFACMILCAGLIWIVWDGISQFIGDMWRGPATEAAEIIHFPFEQNSQE